MQFPFHARGTLSDSRGRCEASEAALGAPHMVPVGSSPLSSPTANRLSPLTMSGCFRALPSAPPNRQCQTAEEHPALSPRKRAACQSPAQSPGAPAGVELLGGLSPTPGSKHSPNPHGACIVPWDLLYTVISPAARHHSCSTISHRGPPERPLSHWALYVSRGPELPFSPDLCEDPQVVTLIRETSTRIYKAYREIETRQ
uniref:Uncharacterized protein n=1 Tax=Knipowitschia caucasica TaxID=637954 RepID=A0AAV2K2M0_KNICA